MRKSLLILNRVQFGYHSGTFYYCKYLPDEYDVTYVCWDYGRPRLELPGITVIYVARDGSKALRYKRFIASAITHARRDFDYFFFQYFPGCSLLRLVRPAREMIFDVRTGSVELSLFRRLIADLILRLEASLFPNVTVISRGLSKKLWFSESRTHVLPLGSEVISANNKHFHELRLLYVGTLQGRRLHETVLGLHQFMKASGDGIACSYTIIGAGWGNEENDLRTLVHTLGLDPVVKVIGRIPHDQLSGYFNKANIGISYIPMTSYYNFQPPTKTFEYLLSGMAVIATATFENRSIVNEENGILIGDSAAEFAAGLSALASRLSTFDSRRIRESSQSHLWANIIRSNLVPYLQTR